MKKYICKLMAVSVVFAMMFQPMSVLADTINGGSDSGNFHQDTIQFSRNGTLIADSNSTGAYVTFKNGQFSVAYGADGKPQQASITLADGTHASAVPATNADGSSVYVKDANGNDVQQWDITYTDSSGDTVTIRQAGSGANGCGVPVPTLQSQAQIDQEVQTVLADIVNVPNSSAIAPAGVQSLKISAKNVGAYSDTGADQNSVFDVAKKDGVGVSITFGDDGHISAFSADYNMGKGAYASNPD